MLDNILHFFLIPGSDTADEKCNKGKNKKTLVDDNMSLWYNHIPAGLRIRVKMIWIQIQHSRKKTGSGFNRQEKSETDPTVEKNRILIQPSRKIISWSDRQIKSESDSTVKKNRILIQPSKKSDLCPTVKIIRILIRASWKTGFGSNR